MNNTKKKNITDLCIASSLFIVTFLAAYMNLHTGHEWGGDFSQYIAQAQAVVTGTVHEFRENNTFIIKNSTDGLGMPVYAWGFPLLLSAFISLGADTIFLMKIPGVLCLSVSVVAVYLLSRRKAGKLVSVAVSLIAALSPELIGSSDQIMSDLPYSAFALMSMLCMEMLGDSAIAKSPESPDTENPVPSGNARKRSKYLLAAITGFLAFYATEIRSNGLAIILTFLCGLILISIKERIPFAKNIPWNPGRDASVIVLTVYAAGMILFRCILPGSPESSSLFGGNFISVMLVNTERNLFVMRKLFALNDPYASYIFYTGFLFLSLAGFIILFEKNFLPAIYCAGSFFLYMIWPYDQGMRFLYSIALLMLPVAASAFELIAKKTKLSHVIAFFTAFLVFLAMLSTFYGGIKTTFRDHRMLDRGAYSEDAEEAFLFIENNTEKDDIIIFKKPRVLFFRTGRLGFTPPQGALKEKLSEADYILTCSELDPYDENEIAESGMKLTPVFHNERFELRKVEK